MPSPVAEAQASSPSDFVAKASHDLHEEDKVVEKSGDSVDGKGDSVEEASAPTTASPSMEVVPLAAIETAATSIDGAMKTNAPKDRYANLAIYGR
jgi:hypothetical protein